MSSGSSSAARESVPKDLDAEERKGLLHGTEDDPEDPIVNKADYQPRSWSRRKMSVTAIAIIGLLFTGTLARTMLFAGAGQASYDGPIFSNGTERYKRTVLLVSIDGLRYTSCLLVLRAIYLRGV